MAGCNRCSSNNVCSSCLLGFSLNNNKCSVCSYPCATCNAQGGCVTCQAPYSLTAATNSTCFTCTTRNCLQCSVSNTSNCLSCASNYQLVQGSCVYSCQDNNCLECFFNNICTKCGPGYTPNGTTGCTPCTNAPQCSECSSSNPSICYKCASGYYLSKGLCTICPFSYC